MASSRLPLYTLRSTSTMVVVSIDQVQLGVERLLASSPLALGFDLEFSQGTVALLQLSSSDWTVLFNIALFKSK